MRNSRSRRPSLVGTMARTAVIAGTATVVSGAVAGSAQQKAQQKDAAQQAQAAAQQAELDAAVQQAVAQQAAAQQAAAVQTSTPAANTGSDVLTQLQQLGELYTAGILSAEEFAAAKAKVLAS